MEIVLSRFLSLSAWNVKIGFSFVPIALAAILYGPMAGAGEFATLAESLMARHYDPRYAKHRARMAVPLAEVEAGPLTADSLTATAARVAAAAAALL